jgi:tRNA nucleotidyltransferase (CCA-adding enzyme)
MTMAPTIPLEKSLTPADFALLRRAGVAAHEQGIHLYLVGGAVRDCLLGEPVVDLDITSEAPADQAVAVLTKAMSAQAHSRSQFGTLKLDVDGRTVDLATARSERYPQAGSLPRVKQGSLKEDLARRDFSINAMAVALAPGEWGTLLDPMGGRWDLEHQVIRALHFTSFRDDATRILRAVRYTHRLGFRLERRTRGWLIHGLSYLETISAARIRRELERMLNEQDPAATLLTAHRWGALAAVHYALGREEAAHTLRAARRYLLGPEELLGILTFNASQQEAEAIATRLALTARQRRVVEELQRLKAMEPILATPQGTPHELVEALEHLSLPSLSAMAVLAPSKVARIRLRKYLSNWRAIRPQLSGQELLRMGVPPGPQVGELLRQLRNGRVDGRLRSRRAELAHVRAILTRG